MRCFTGEGTFLAEVGVEISNDETVTPAVACYEQANEFYVAWRNTGEGVFNTRRIEGRTLAASTLEKGNKRTLSFGQGDEADPDVGAPSNFERMRSMYDDDLARMRADWPVNETPAGLWRLFRYADCVRVLRELDPARLAALAEANGS